MKNPDTKLKLEIEERDMIKVGEWELVEREIHEFHYHNPTLAKDESIETTDTVHSHRNMWRHSDGKTYLKVFHNSMGNYDAVVYMGSHETDSVGPGWTCGVDCRNVDPQEAVEWAENYMQENSDVSHLYD